METDDDAQSYRHRPVEDRTPSSPDHPSLPAAAAALIKAAALSSGGGSANGGGREDCWSEGATAVLIEAWGERFLELSRGNLRQHHWQEVADIVSAREDYTKPSKSDVQCKNRVDTLKKKYKIEKSRSPTASKWVFFRRLDQLLGSSNSKPPSPPPPAAKAGTHIRVAPYIPAAIPVGPRSFHHFKRNKVRLPYARPAPKEENSKPARLPEKKRGEGLRELTTAIRKFGEVYERVERSKLKQAAEMERQRMGFAKELELQRMQFFMKSQLELTQLNRDGGAAVADAPTNGTTDNSD